MTRLESLPIPDAVHDILTDKPTGFVATVRPDGMLSVTPVGLMFDGEYVRFSTTRDRRKYRNLLRDDRVTMAVAHRNNPNRYVEIRGRARMEDDPDHTFIDASRAITWASTVTHSTGRDRFASPSRSSPSTCRRPRSRSPTTRPKRAILSPRNEEPEEKRARGERARGE